MSGKIEVKEPKVVIWWPVIVGIFLIVLAIGGYLSTVKAIAEQANGNSGDIKIIIRDQNDLRLEVVEKLGNMETEIATISTILDERLPKR